MGMVCHTAGFATGASSFGDPLGQSIGRDGIVIFGQDLDHLTCQAAPGPEPADGSGSGRAAAISENRLQAFAPMAE